jgi:protein-disulfide isomerase
MKKLAVACVLALVAGCDQGNSNLEKKVDKLAEDIKSIKTSIDGLKAAGGVAGAAAPGGRGAAQPRPPRPTADPAKTYSVPVEGAPFEGPADALVTVVKAYEYACPFCEKVRPTLAELKKKYGKDLRVVYKQFVVHPQVATSPALAVCAAHRQGKFLQMDEAVWEKVFKARKFDKDKCWTGADGAAKGAAEAGAAAPGGCENLEAIAKEVGLDVGKFKADMAGACMAQIQKEQKEMQVVGVGATPGFFINGRFLSGAQPLESFQALIDDELKKAKERVAGGTPQGSYYKTWIVEKGEKQAEIK